MHSQSGNTKTKGFFLVFSRNIFTKWGFMGRKGTTIPKASVARILIKAGAKRVSDDAVSEFTEKLTDMALSISKKANDIAKHAGRKTIHEGDIKLAVKK